MNLKLASTALLLAVSPLIALSGASITSGPSKGMRMLPFGPKHVTGADAGTHTCPVCKYGKINGVQIWVNGEKQSTVAKLATLLDQMIAKRGLSNLRGVIVFIKPPAITKEKYDKVLTDFANNYKLKYVAVTYVDGPKAEGIRYYKINTNPKVRTTTLVFSKLKVRANFLNLAGDTKSVQKLSEATDAMFMNPKAGR